MFAVVPDSVLSLQTNGLLLLVFIREELMCLHAAAAALPSDVLFVVSCLIFLLSVECQQQSESTLFHHTLVVNESDVANWTS